jgi:hydrogenase nickel incorporation protein HypA/HybF
MHELSVARNIIEIVEMHTSEQVLEMEMDIGTLSGVIPESLQFALEISTRGTILEGAKIKMNVIPAEARCLDCDHVFKADDLYTACPKCQGLRYEIIRGKELRVVTINVA